MMQDDNLLAECIVVLSEHELVELLLSLGHFHPQDLLHLGWQGLLHVLLHPPAGAKVQVQVAGLAY